MTATDRLFLGQYSVGAAYAVAFGVQPAFVRAGGGDFTAGGGFSFNSGNIVLGDDTIYSGDGNNLVFGDDAVVEPTFSASYGLMTGMDAFPIDELGSPGTAGYNYIYGFGAFGSVHQWQSAPTGRASFNVDADTIYGGAGTNVLYGELGDDTIIGGSGNEYISGGFGFNTVTGGGGQTLISFNRATDSHYYSGGNDIARGVLDFTSDPGVLSATVYNPFIGDWRQQSSRTRPRHRSRLAFMRYRRMCRN